MDQGFKTVARTSERALGRSKTGCIYPARTPEEWEDLLGAASVARSEPRYLRRLNRYLAKLERQIQEWCPGARVQVSLYSVEGEDARLEVFPPKSVKVAERRKLWNRLLDAESTLYSRTRLAVQTAVYDRSEKHLVL